MHARTCTLLLTLLLRHGSSIGSLGKRKEETDVNGITVRNCTLIGTSNGARIKTYRASPQLKASSIVFEDLILHNVTNPIIIDQDYNSQNKIEVAQHPLALICLFTCINNSK